MVVLEPWLHFRNIRAFNKLHVQVIPQTHYIPITYKSPGWASTWLKAFQVSLTPGLQVWKTAPSVNVKSGWELAKEEKHSRQKEHSVGYKWKNNQPPWVESTHSHNASAHFNMSAPFYLSAKGHWLFKSMSISGFYLVIHSVIPTCIPNQYDENIFLSRMWR